MSPVRSACVPPHSSTEYFSPSAPPIDSTRTSSPYFSPNSAMAPAAIASSGVISRVSTELFSRMRSLTSSSTVRSSSGRDRLGVADVEAQPVGRDQRALLRDMRAEMAAQRLVQQMGRRMMRAQLGAADRIDGHDHVVADLDLALLDLGVMGMQVAHHLLHVGDRRLAVGADEAAGVALLAAELGVERRLVGDQPAGLAGLERRHLLAVDHDRRDLALGALGVVAQELGGADLLAHVEPDRLVGRLARARPRRARLGALLVHRLVEAGRVDRDVARAQHVLRQVEREAERVVELEGDLALQRAAGAQAPGLVVEQLAGRCRASS